jgi:transglutaminase-like putative cysteine protease
VRGAETVAGRPARTARETWFDHGVIALALVLLLSGFGTIVEGRDWWVTTVLVAAMTGLTCAVLRVLGTPFVALLAILVELVAVVFIFVPDTLLAIVPTPQTVTALADLVSVAQQTIVEEKAPVAASRPIVLVVAVSFGLIVVVADLLLQRRRAAPLVGGLLLAVFATPALISGETPPAWLFLAVAGLWLVLLRSRTATATRSGRSRLGAAPALALGAAALVGAVAFPAVAPDVSAVAASWGKPPQQVFGRGINPMIELGQNLRRNSTATALTYTTTFDEAQYLKVATLRDFTGRAWKPAQTVRDDPSEGVRLFSSDIEVRVGRTKISIDQLRSSMLPVPYPSTGQVSGLDGEWTFRTAGQTLTSRNDDSRGETYTVSSLDVRPTAEQMRALRTTVGPSLESYVELPRRMPSIIARTARQVTADADNDYDRALALQKFFRDGDFRYSETAPVAGDYDGNGVDVIAEFLRKKAGYCVHFSSAMAVMARSLDMPARIAVGYAPGTSNVRDGQTVFTNTSDDLHAWTEIYFEGAGWVRFDPTTSVGAATSFVEPVVDAPDAEPTPTPQATQPAPQRGADRLDQPAAAPAEQGSTAPRSAIVTLAAVLVVGAVPWAVRGLRRRWRSGRGRTDVEPLWRELEDVARDLRIPASAADTPRGFASRLAVQPGVDDEALQALLQRVEHARFARGEQPAGDGVADLDAVVTSLRAGASTRRRLLAALLPQSLAGRAPVARVAGSGTLAT